ncbi:MAG: hypothetical protein K2Q18_11760 [Bdellovibrionales bacterium]|nr:hypothetical protein [Bdellovibrionales bacterium]
MKYLFTILLLLTLGCSHWKRGPAQVDRPLVGIYTGSFDPPTNAHKNIMLMASEKYPLDELYIFVNVSGSKDFKTSFNERKEMIEGMFAGSGKKIRVVAILQENKNEVIENISSRFNTVQFIGQDSFEGLPEESMKDPNRKWVVFPRGDKELVIPKDVNAETMEVGVETSSSEVRALILEQRIQEADIDPFVAEYIMKHKLYVSLSDKGLEELKYKNFVELFARYKKSLSLKYPKMDLSDVALPKYLPEQSRSAWTDKFSNAVIKVKGISGNNVEDFRMVSEIILLELSKNMTSHNEKINSCNPSILINLFN